MVTKALSSLWTDRCDVWVRENLKNTGTGRTGFCEKLLLKDVPCRVSYTGLYPVTGSRGAARQRIKSSILSLGASPARGTVKLFAAPGVDIPPGSRVVVKREGRETAYHQSGVPAVYPSHIEILLELEQEWA